METILRKILLTLCLATLCAGLYGQQLGFTEKSWNFGRIREEGGAVTHRFDFTNTGSKPVVLEEVEVSCGCTTADFTRKPVMPGQSGHVTVAYDPLGRPGPFTKTAVVKANNRSLSFTLSVSGEVQEREYTVEELYPVVLSAGVRLSGRTAALRNVAQGEARSATIRWANTSSKAVRLSFEADPAIPHLKIFAQETLPAGGRGEITFTIDLSGKKDAYGVFSGGAYPVVNGVRERLPVTVMAYGIDPTGDPADFDKSARARFDRQYHDFGDVASARPLSTQFTLSNTGSQPLVVRYVRPGKGLTVSLEPGVQVAPGKSVTFTVGFDPAAHPRGVINESILLIVNDPMRPVRELRMAAYKK